MKSEVRFSSAHSWIRRLPFAFIACLIVFSATPEVSAAERFQMAVFHNFDAGFVDLEWIEMPRPGAPGNGQSGSGRKGIVLINYFLEKFPEWKSLADTQIIANVVNYLQGQNYEWNRIDAVLVDEPYWSVALGNESNPCAAQGEPRFQDMLSMQRYLVDIASAVRQVAPTTTRFWVNFSRPEIQWMRAETCPLRLNDWFMDVVSLDIYETPFNGTIKGHYDWLFANRPTAYQQLALIPGTFRIQGTLTVDAATAATWLQQYFAYANTMNASCTLPIGRTGVTRSFDGCPVWLVAGFWGDANHVSDRGNGITWISMLDSSSLAIKQKWTEQLAIPRRDNLLGRVDTFNIAGRTISGWAIDRTLPDVSPYVDVWLDANTPQAKFLGTALASAPRQDILSGYGILPSGFSLQVEKFPRGCHQVDVYAVARAPGTGNAWMGSTSYCREAEH